MTEDINQGPLGSLPESPRPRLTEATLAEAVGVSGPKEFAITVSARTMPLLRKHVQRIRESSPPGYIVGPRGRVSFGDMAAKYLEIMEQRPGGLFFGEEDLEEMWDKQRDGPFKDVTDQIILSLYWHAFSRQAVTDIIYGPPQIFFGGLIDLLHFPDPQAYPLELREEFFANRLVQLIRTAAFRRPNMPVPMVLFDLGLMWHDVEQMKGGIYNFIVPPAVVASFMERLEPLLGEPERALLNRGKNATPEEIVAYIRSGVKQSLN